MSKNFNMYRGFKIFYRFDSGMYECSELGLYEYPNRVKIERAIDSYLANLKPVDTLKQLTAILSTQYDKPINIYVTPDCTYICGIPVSPETIDIRLPNGERVSIGTLVYGKGKVNGPKFD